MNLMLRRDLNAAPFPQSALIDDYGRVRSELARRDLTEPNLSSLIKRYCWKPRPFSEVEALLNMWLHLPERRWSFRTKEGEGWRHRWAPQEGYPNTRLMAAISPWASAEWGMYRPDLDADVQWAEVLATLDWLQSEIGRLSDEEAAALKPKDRQGLRWPTLAVEPSRVAVSSAADFIRGQLQQEADPVRQATAVTFGLTVLVQVQAQIMRSLLGKHESAAQELSSQSWLRYWNDRNRLPARSSREAEGRVTVAVHHDARLPEWAAAMLLELANVSHRGPSLIGMSGLTYGVYWRGPNSSWERALSAALEEVTAMRGREGLREGLMRLALEAWGLP